MFYTVTGARNEKSKQEGIENVEFGEQRSEFKVVDKPSAKKAAVIDRVLMKRNPSFCIGTIRKMLWGKTASRRHQLLKMHIRQKGESELSS